MIGCVSPCEIRSHIVPGADGKGPQMPPPILRFSVSVLMQRTPLQNRWVSERWDPVAVVPVPSDAAQAGSPVRVRDDDTCTQWRFDGHALELHRSEAEGYHRNLV